METAFFEGSLLSPLTRRGDRFFVQDCAVDDLCAQFKTPFYLCDADFVVGRYRYLQQIFTWPRTHIHYAMKANSNPHLLRALRDAGARLDTVSPAEVLLALKLGFAKDKIIFTANSMTDEEILMLKDLGVLFNIDSLSGLRRYAALYPNSDVCLRFNAEVVAGEHAIIQTGGDKTKFGIRFELLPQALDIARQHGLKIVGIHEHTGSGIADINLFIQGMKNLLRIATPARFPDLRFVDFGGGFKVPYRPEEKRIDYDAFGVQASTMFKEFCAGFGRDLDLYFEPGKFIAAEGSLLIVRVNSLIQNKTRLIAGTDSGFNHLIRPILYEAYHPIVNLSNPQGEMKMYDVCGNICETGDLFASDRMLPEIREGDFLAILNAGAYGYTMGMEYNMRPLPTEVVVQNNAAFLSRQALSPAQFVDRFLSNVTSR